MNAIIRTGLLQLVGLCILSYQLLSAEPLLCREQPSRMESPSREDLKDRTEWFGAYFQGNKCGWARVTYKKITKNEKDAFVVEMESIYKIASLGNIFDAYALDHQEFLTTPPYSFTGGEYRQKQDGLEIRIGLKKHGRDFVAEIHDAGTERQLAVTGPDFCLTDHFTVMNWIQDNPTVGRQLDVRNFSFPDLKESVDTYQVVFSGEKEVQGTLRKALEVSLVSSVRGAVGRITFDSKGQTLLVRQGDAFVMRRETEEQAKRINSRADFFVGGIVRVDQALGESPTEISSLVLDVTGKNISSFRSGPGISIEKNDRNNSCRVTTGYYHTEKITATPEEIEENLEETLDYPINDSEVRVMARQSCIDAETDRDKIRAMVDFIGRFLAEDNSSHVMSVKETIREKAGDCSERAALLVTMARATGIPAREVHGLVYTSDLFASFGGHSWCEVVVDGIWIPIDPSMGQTCVDGTHIRLDSGKKGLSRLLAVMGDASFSLVSVEREGPAVVEEDTSDTDRKTRNP